MFNNKIVHHMSVFSRTDLEQCKHERDKLMTDLGEANNRIGLLIKEGDERHVTLENARQKDVM